VGSPPSEQLPMRLQWGSATIDRGLIHAIPTTPASPKPNVFAASPTRSTPTRASLGSSSGAKVASMPQLVLHPQQYQQPTQSWQPQLHTQQPPPAPAPLAASQATPAASRLAGSFPQGSAALSGISPPAVGTAGPPAVVPASAVFVGNGGGRGVGSGTSPDQLAQAPSAQRPAPTSPTSRDVMSTVLSLGDQVMATAPSLLASSPSLASHNTPTTQASSGSSGLSEVSVWAVAAAAAVQTQPTLRQASAGAASNIPAPVTALAVGVHQQHLHNHHGQIAAQAQHPQPHQPPRLHAASLSGKPMTDALGYAPDTAVTGDPSDAAVPPPAPTQPGRGGSSTAGAGGGDSPANTLDGWREMKAAFESGAVAGRQDGDTSGGDSTNETPRGGAPTTDRGLHSQRSRPLLSPAATSLTLGAPESVDQLASMSSFTGSVIHPAARSPSQLSLTFNASGTTAGGPQETGLSEPTAGLSPPAPGAPVFYEVDCSLLVREDSLLNPATAALLCAGAPGTQAPGAGQAALPQGIAPIRNEFMTVRWMVLMRNRHQGEFSMLQLAP
jgi:hypothetical protein